MTSEEAKEIIAKGYISTGIPSHQTVQQNWNFRMAEGYLAALKGPEISALLMKLELAESWSSVSNAIAQYREVVQP